MTTLAFHADLLGHVLYRWSDAAHGPSPVLGTSCPEFGQMGISALSTSSTLGERRGGLRLSPTSVAAVTATDSDAELLERVASGDQRAYRELVDRHVRGVHAFVYRMLRSRAEAEEVCQESFLRLWQQADTFVAHAKPSTWLYRVAHNLAVDRLRRRREGSHPSSIEDVPTSERSSVLVYDKQVAEAVDSALAALPERQRAALSLVHYQGMSNAEAAEVLGVKVRALESLLARGRQQLRERLRDFNSQEGNDP
jgi:RNA polymerase sigma-70 factor, ECF subfamily